MVKSEVYSSEKMRFSESTSSMDNVCLTSGYFLTNNLSGYVNRLYKELTEINPYNAMIIRDYIGAEKVEINIKESTKVDKIKKLCLLSRFFRHNRCFWQMTKTDILSYLNSLRKPPSEDPTHRSVGTYNGRQMVFMKFFRWLYNSDEPEHKKRITPPCMAGVKSLPRREKSPYKPDDIWTADDHSTFLKYYHMARDRCWHTMVHDMSARPHEILNLKIKDILFKLTPDGVQYAEILIRGGKTKPRTLPLIDSIPYVKDWINNHPTGNNPESWLFVSLSYNTFGSKLSYDGLSGHYKYYYRSHYFPQLLHDDSVPDPDKIETEITYLHYRKNLLQSDYKIIKKGMLWTLYSSPLSSSTSENVCCAVCATPFSSPWI